MGTEGLVSHRSDQLLAPLKQYFGFSSFRPLQEDIIRDSLAGKDVFAVLPTGGGKSLCFQLPALVRPGLTVVVSPLIALMKDQVDALVARGIDATLINSTLTWPEQKERLDAMRNGSYKLVYVAPERFRAESFLKALHLPFLTRISDSDNYLKAVEAGLGVFEMHGAGASVQRRELMPILNWLALDERRADFAETNIFSITRSARVAYGS